ncbi:S41 family peptidase [Mucilaginibacter daejeonensis]|uniref:S41 family peptidase n=1 Tax=Mucilaginibacter daejeonensis TaxID=398049 RepID=UPI001D17601C|nr:S41 family peptidase [Mucilaginibacter daejeonensis]UEG51464.1 S41 family peptidase [Mucilaginibacter daejeonensis]
MKRLYTFIFLCFVVTAAYAQISDPGFEAVSDTLSTQPLFWEGTAEKGYTMKVATDEHRTGNRSLQIQGTESLQGRQSIYQATTIKMDTLKQILLTCYVKTKDVSSSVQLFCQVWDSRNRIISTRTSQMQDSGLSGTNDWKQLTLKFLADTNARRVKLGAYLMGNGTVWLDDFALQELPNASGEASKDLIKFAGEITSLVRKRSIYADSVNWQAVDMGIKTLAASGLTMEESPLILDFIISRLRLAGDKHSNYKTKTSAQSYAIRNNVILQPEGKLLKGDIGYIAVPGFGSVSDTASVNFAKRIQDLIMDTDTQQEIKGWVVDMRQNGGGNMAPMIAGLGPLIGEGTVGYFVYPDSKDRTRNVWTYNKGSFDVDGRKQVSVKRPYTLRKQDSKIAVLIGPNTGSSGEMATLSFVGRPDTKLFGEPTAGYMTTNQSIKLSTGAYLYLATGYAADRNKKSYLTDIKPDLKVATEKDKEKDKALDEAMAWLTN